uniref:NADH-ubiquinone oxidoreductase chain 5 n=1 Tax=Pleuropoma jana TaxID=1882665 RepID=A0A1B2G3B4_9GAST|nr:NADH dehydrogenase subunit 5 [Pleuropoma jana]
MGLFCLNFSFFLFFITLLTMPFVFLLWILNFVLVIEWVFSLNVVFSLTFTWMFDFVSLSFCALVSFISACVMMFSYSYMGSDVFIKRFSILVMMFVLSMNLLIFTPNLIALLLGWDGLGLVSFILVIYYQNFKSLNAGLVTAFTNRLGDALLLFVIAICVNNGIWDLVCAFNSNFVLVCFCFVVGAMTKSAQVPFSSWLPLAMAAPTPVSALVHSSTLVTAGLFIMVRFYNILILWDYFVDLVLVIGTITLLMAGVCAIYENDLKKIVALSTLSQLGVMMLSFFLLNWGITLFHLYSHALFKALLFLCVGVAIHNNFNTQDIRFIGSLYKEIPLVTICLLIANLALCGMPFLSGFYSKDLILESMIFKNTNLLIFFMIFFGTGLTVGYSTRLVLAVFLSENKFNFSLSCSENDKFLIIPILCLSIVSVVGGKFMQLFFCDFYYFNILSVNNKMMIMFIILFGVWISFIFWFNMESKLFSSSLNFFFSTMWFLSFVVIMPFSFYVFFFSEVGFIMLNSGWNEIVVNKGVLNISFYFMNLIQIVQSKVFNLWVFLMVMFVFIFMFF